MAVFFVFTLRVGKVSIDRLKVWLTFFRCWNHERVNTCQRNMLPFLTPCKALAWNSFLMPGTEVWWSFGICSWHACRLLLLFSHWSLTNLRMTEACVWYRIAAVPWQMSESKAEGSCFILVVRTVKQIWTGLIASTLQRFRLDISISSHCTGPLRSLSEPWRWHGWHNCFVLIVLHDWFHSSKIGSKMNAFLASLTGKFDWNSPWIVTCPCVTCVGGHACELWRACVDSHCTVFQLLPLGCCALLRGEMITTANFQHEFGLVKMSQMAQQFLVSGLKTYQMVAYDMFSVEDVWRALDEVISAITSSMTKLDLLTVQRRGNGFRRQLFTITLMLHLHNSSTFFNLLLWIHTEIESPGIPSSLL